jgi:hypothetical protein
MMITALNTLEQNLNKRNLYIFQLTIDLEKQLAHTLTQYPFPE